ncbi:MAG TPA: ABC transporter ATP-binding protein [Candidatus Limnocylindria bacterium]|nr:ABC transporter ATP-binding protein [Candidatus Limnocylindria bacterium]
MTEAPPTPPFISLTSVTKTWASGSTVLDQVSLTAAKGDFISLIGPSGCGKSTLLKLLSGLSPLTSGLITLDGMQPDAAREIMSFIFQDATLLPWRTVQGNVELGLELERKTTREQRRNKCAELLRLVGLADVANHYPRQLSGGMKMRVSIARALATRPKILLMDEPFGALDEMTRDFLNEEVLRLRDNDQFTTFFVTHSVAEAVFLSTRIVVLRAKPGRIEREIPVPFPFPRTASLRSAPEYLALVGEVSAALRAVKALA